jgi:NitT/TauT family transport system substrate-binding protein
MGNPDGRRRSLRAVRFATVALWLSAAPAPPGELAKLSFGNNWLAEPEHGGFYEALADGTYARYGLDVTIVQGGPGSNARMLAATGRMNCDMESDMTAAMDAVRSPASFRRTRRSLSAIPAKASIRSRV